MSPLLSSQQQPDPDEDYKFVRVGETIAFDDWQLDHSDIAEDHNLGDAIGDTRAMARRLVDDAGMIYRLGERFAIDGRSSTCKLRGDVWEAREKTVKLVEQITGREIER